MNDAPEPDPPRDVTRDRPNPSRRWRCGLEAIGAGCPHGPTRTGRCGLLDQRNLGSPEGGSDAVEQRLEPCSPIRYAWYSRERLSIHIAVLVAGVLLVCMVIPQREQVFVPGGLSRKHSQILDNHLAADRCSACHPSSHATGEQPLFQDDLCMRCHRPHLPDAALRSPHDLTPRQLTALSHPDRRNPASGLALLREQMLEATDPIATTTACASCHIEHRGEHHDITRINDARCQACHRESFASFADGHPEFERYPYFTPRRIAFDHRAHAVQHFGQKGRQFDCRQCHVQHTRIGLVGSVFRGVDFEQACAECHEQPMKAATIDGWAFLQIPSIDPQAFEESDTVLRHWPAAARFGFDGRLSLPMLVLLSSDTEVRAALKSLTRPGEFTESDAAEQQQAIRRIALGIVQLIEEVAAEGQTACEARLRSLVETTWNRAPSATEEGLIAEMVAGLPPDLFRAARRQWLAAGGNDLASSHGSSLPHVSLATSQNDLLLDDSSDDLNETLRLRGTPPRTTDIPVRRKKAALNEAPRAPESSNKQRADELLSGDWDTHELLDAPESKGHPTSLEAAKELSTLSGTQHVGQGGWYLDHELLAIRYMPRGHADPLQAAWIEFTTRLAQAQANNTLADNGTDWAHRITEVPGDCLACHQLGASLAASPVSGGGSPWRSLHRPENVRRFTNFDHTPHLQLPALSDCRHCHRLDDDAALADEAFASSNAPVAGTSLTDASSLREALRPYGQDFLPIRREQCAACHHSHGANDGCTQCHNYHVGSEGWRWSR